MKTYYLTLSQVFPVTHPRAGEETHFKDWLVGSLYYGATSGKIHTIRANFELWQKRFEDIYAGKACLSVRYWEGKPYRSKQHEIVRLTKDDGIGIQKLEFPFGTLDEAMIEDAEHVGMFGGIAQTFATNDGLSLNDWKAWFKDYDLSKQMAIIHFTKFRY